MGHVMVTLFHPEVIPSEDAHTHFGRNIGGPMEAVGLSSPKLEHLDVLKVDLENISRGESGVR